MRREDVIQTVGERAIPEQHRKIFDREFKAGKFDAAEKIARNWIGGKHGQNTLTETERNGLLRALDDALILAVAA